MEDPEDSMKTVSAKDYNRTLPKKLYEISSDVSADQLNSIINDNIKIENENNLNVPSQSSSLAAFPNSFKKEGEELLPGEGEESEDEGGTESATETESDNNILPENPLQVVQNNNSGVNRQLTENEIARRNEYNAMKNDEVLNHFP
jgi:hypothetical protein